jgi:hypothetical protein
VVYKNKPQNLDKLESKINRVFQQIPQDFLHRAADSVGV